MPHGAEGFVHLFIAFLKMVSSYAKFFWGGQLTNFIVTKISHFKGLHGIKTKQHLPVGLTHQWHTHDCPIRQLVPPDGTVPCGPAGQSCMDHGGSEPPSSEIHELWPHCECVKGNYKNIGNFSSLIHKIDKLLHLQIYKFIRKTSLLNFGIFSFKDVSSSLQKEKVAFFSGKAI